MTVDQIAEKVGELKRARDAYDEAIGREWNAGLITLDFSFDEAQLVTLQCMMANARNRFGNACKEGDAVKMAYYGGSLGAYVDVLGLASPLEPDGSESDKPS